jgi:hypothetical protein
MLFDLAEPIEASAWRFARPRDETILTRRHSRSRDEKVPAIQVQFTQGISP